MDENNIKNDCIQLMETADVAYLSTVNADGFPETRAMANLRNSAQFPHLTEFFKQYNQDITVFVATDTASGKYKQIQANPKTSVYFCNPQQIQGLLLIGEIELIDDMNIKKKLWQDDWNVYFPNGLEGPEYNVFALKPKTAKFWKVPMPETVELTLK